jgi:hypothetical protein
LREAIEPRARAPAAWGDLLAEGRAAARLERGRT